MAVATNKGAIISPFAHDDEKDTVKDLLKVQIEPSTVNGGVPFVRSGLLATSHGAVIGPLTLGKELMAISQVMQL
jgi:translation initiation factor 6